MGAIKQYRSDDGSDITLSCDIIRRQVAGNDQVTDRECMEFMAMCSAQRLNPFTREAYLIKYGNSPASMVVGKDVFTKRAFRNPKFRGFRAGIYVVTQDGKGKEREGSMVLPGESVVGGWAEVYLEGYEVPIKDTVSFEEYAGRKRDGILHGQWAKMPGTMIRKVALVHALREAFPEDLGGLYDSTEMGMDEAKLPTDPIEAVATVEEVPEAASEAASCEAATETQEIPLREPPRHRSVEIEEQAVELTTEDIVF